MHYISEDLCANKGNTKGAIIVLLYRVTNMLASSNVFLRLLVLPLIIFYKVIVNWVLGVDIDYKLCAGKGLVVFHGQGLVVNADTVMGDHVTLRHNTTIGNKRIGGASPRIGSNVDIGANSVIIGPVCIGNNVIIGAGSVVVNDLPDDTVAVGNPARIIRKTSLPETDNKC